LNVEAVKGVSVDIDSFQKVLNHPIRRKVILTLKQSGSLSYMDLMGTVEASNTGKFNYHLKILADLIQKDSNGKYLLTEKGQLAAQFLLTFKEKGIEPSSLSMADGLLIGFAGFAITLANPAFWTFFLAVGVGVKSIPLFMALQFLTLVCSIILPGVLMWKLTVRRSHSHNSYDLYKAPIMTLAMLLPLFVASLVFHFTIFANAIIQGAHSSGAGWTSTHTVVIPMSLATVILYGLFASFLGVAISEFIYRFRRRRSSNL
jgi:hypothetical protein